MNAREIAARISGTVAEIRQGRSSTPRCEPPGAADREIAREISETVIDGLQATGFRLLAPGEWDAETLDRLSNYLDPEIGLPSDRLLRGIHADIETRGRKSAKFAVSVHHRNITLSAVAAALRNMKE